MTNLNLILENLQERAKEPLVDSVKTIIERDFNALLDACRDNTDQETEHPLCSSDTTPVRLVRVAGLGTPVEMDETAEVFHCSMFFISEKGTKMRLSWKLKHLCNWGPEVKKWDFIVQGVDMDDFIIEACMDDKLQDFLNEHFMSEWYFNEDESPLTNDELSNIAKIIGMGEESNIDKGNNGVEEVLVELPSGDKLSSVSIALESGDEIELGVLRESETGLFFAVDASYLQQEVGDVISPYGHGTLKFNDQ